MMRGFFLAAFTALMLSAAVAKADTLWLTVTAPFANGNTIGTGVDTPFNVSNVLSADYEFTMPGVDVGTVTGSPADFTQTVTFTETFADQSQKQASGDLHWTYNSADNKFTVDKKDVYLEWRNVNVTVEAGSVNVTTGQIALTATLTDAPPARPVPLPATAWMGLALLGGIGAHNIRRRMKNA